MRLAIKSQGVGEFIGLKFNLAPMPFLHTNVYSTLARTLAEAVAHGVFESIGVAERTIEEIAAATGLNPSALSSLLAMLVSTDYLKYSGGKFTTTKFASKWLLKDSPTSVCDAVVLLRQEWHLFDHFEEFLKTGEGHDFHDTLGPEEWKTYQRAMFQLARLGVKEIAKKTPVPAGATAMLDIGGSHGLYSVELCKRFPSMTSVVLDLPSAITAAAPILESINAEGRVRHQAGDILTDDIGEARYDLVFICSLVHHFTDEQNRMIAGKVARALKPGGFFIIQDYIRPSLEDHPDVVRSMQHLLFGLTSSVGLYTLEEEQAWQRDAGLEHHKVVNFMTAPLDVQVVARKK